MNKDEIEQSLRQEATRISRSEDFWAKLTEAIVAGKIKGINPSTHLRSPKRPEKIAKDIHQLIGDGTPYGELHRKVRAVYLELVTVVLKGLGF